MRTRLSTKGQVVLPQQVRENLGLRPGDPLDARIDGQRIILTPTRPRGRKGQIVKDNLTGWPVLAAAKNSPVLTSKQVAGLLADFP